MIEQILFEINYEYEGSLRLSSYYFNKYIDEGLESDKEKELLYCGAAHALLRLKEKIIPQMIKEHNEEQIKQAQEYNERRGK